ncbi:MAG TPA: hypothetical protein VN778_04945 [Verrucomicrobiae bacterium]|nr:hypothetical protein [Verrucomicrobiae bacterium]
MKQRLADNQKGSIILVFIITLPFLILLAMYYMSLSLTSFQVSRLDQLHTEAQLAADAGADYAVEQLAQNTSWAGTGSEITLHSDSSLRTTYTATVTGSSSSKTIAVTGNTYWPASATTPTRSVSVDIDLYPVTTGNYSVVAGAGGLFMSNSSKITGGSVFINGEISMSNSAQIGLSTNPVSVQVADDICPSPADSTYPKVCTSGNPITINNTAHIYGAVTATNQTNGSGMSNTGLTSGGSVAPQALPTYTRPDSSHYPNSLTGNQASCSGSQAVTWPAGTKITGNVTLSNSCTVTVQGDVWITGTLNLSNTTKMIVSNTVGSTQPVIMIDGQGGATFSNSTQIVSNSSSTGIEFITFYSMAACSPSCASVTGTDLANSRSISTITLSNTAAAPNSVFYAYWTQVQLSNSGQLGAVIGQTIQMSNTAAITFGSAQAGVGNTTWIVKGYHRQ